MANTFIKIASTTVGSGGASDITFSSIPGTYTDLCLYLSGRYSNAGTQATLWISQINGSASGFSNRWIRGSGSSVFTSSDVSGGIYVGQVNASSSTANTFTNINMYFPEYAGSKNKSVIIDAIQENNQTEAYMGVSGGLWANTAAITSITIDPDGGNSFAQYTTASLYGIKKS
jgi:hypothetical protein